MADKYLYLDGSGNTAERELTVTSTGVSEAGKGVALDSAGKLTESVMPVGIGKDAKMMTTSEAVAAGDFVNVWYDTGAAKIRKADGSTTGKQADGFVLAGAALGETVDVYFEGTNTQLSGLTPASTPFLSVTTPGGVQETAPTGSGQIVQQLGRVLSATEISFEPSKPIVRA